MTTFILSLRTSEDAIEILRLVEETSVYSLEVKFKIGRTIRLMDD